MQQEPTWQRQLLIGIAALVTVALILGGLFAIFAVKAADYLGVGNDATGSQTPAPVLPTTGSATASAPPTSPTSSAPTTTTKTSPRPVKSIVLRASPRSAGSFERVNLTGTYAGKDGVLLQVQRSVGGAPWADFPTDITVRAGRFATYIKTAMLGANKFRMLDKSNGRSSNVVTVTIG